MAISLFDRKLANLRIVGRMKLAYVMNNAEWYVHCDQEIDTQYKVSYGEDGSPEKIQEVGTLNAWYAPEEEK